MHRQNQYNNSKSMLGLPKQKKSNFYVSHRDSRTQRTHVDCLKSHLLKHSLKKYIHKCYQLFVQSIPKYLFVNSNRLNKVPRDLFNLLVEIFILLRFRRPAKYLTNFPQFCPIFQIFIANHIQPIFKLPNAFQVV